MKPAASLVVAMLAPVSLSDWYNAGATGIVTNGR